MSSIAAGIGAGAVGSAIGGYFGYKAQQAQNKAALRAQREALAAQNVAANKGIGTMAEMLANAQGAVQGGYGTGQYQLGQGYEQAQGQLAQGYGQSLQDIYGAGAQARGDIGQTTEQATGTLGAMGQQYAGAQNRLSGLLDQGLYSDFTQDPGYQFRQQQGEQAIQRAAAAQGGRLGGGTLKELANFNQGLASQEFGNYANRQNALAGLASAEYGQTLANLGAQSGLAGQTAGLQAGAGSNLANLAMQTGGQAAAAQQGLAQGQSGLSVGQGTGAANMAVGQGTSLANLYTGYGQGVANTLQAQSATSAPLYGMAIPYAGGGWNAAAQGMNQALGLGALYYGATS